MKRSGFFILIIGLSIYLAMSSSIAADIATVTSSDRSSVGKTKKEVFFKCTRGKELRWMRLYYQKNGRCKTVYSKGGDAKEVSTGLNYETCENVLNNIKKNLEAGSYICEEKVLIGALEIE